MDWNKPVKAVVGGEEIPMTMGEAFAMVCSGAATGIIDPNHKPVTWVKVSTEDAVKMCIKNEKASDSSPNQRPE